MSQMGKAPNRAEFIRTPDANFNDLADYPFAAHYFDFNGLRMHYVDEGPRNGPGAILMRGMPTWSYLIRATDAIGKLRRSP